MSDKIIKPTGFVEKQGEPSANKINMQDLIQKARDDWSTGKKNEAFQTAMSGMVLLTKGIARLMHDVDGIRKYIKVPDEQPPQDS